MFSVFFECETGRVRNSKLDIWFNTGENNFRFNQRGKEAFTAIPDFDWHDVISDSYFHSKTIPSNSIYPEPRLSFIGDFTV